MNDKQKVARYLDLIKRRRALEEEEKRIGNTIVAISTEIFNLQLNRLPIPNTYLFDDKVVRITGAVEPPVGSLIVINRNDIERGDDA